MLLALLGIAITAVTAGCHSAPVLEPPRLPSISGTITLEGATTLPGNAVLAVRLVDLERHDASRVVIEQIVSRPDNFPYRYRLYYEQSSIDYSRDYGVEAAVTENGRPTWKQAQPNPVLTKGRPEIANIVLQRAQ